MSNVPGTKHKRIFVQCQELLQDLPEGFTLKPSEREIIDSLIQRKIIWGTQKQTEFLDHLRARIALYRSLLLGTNDSHDIADYFETIGYADVAELLRVNHVQQG